MDQNNLKYTHYTKDSYKTQNIAWFQKYIADELWFIKTSVSANQDVIYIWAWNGRLIPELADICHHCYAIEINPSMYTGLEEIANQYDNVTPIHWDAMQLQDIVTTYEIQNPVLLIAQNTLGTIEWNREELLNEMRIYATKCGAQIILSFLDCSSLKGRGIELYTASKEMVWEIDHRRSNLDWWLFVSQSWYVSKRRTKQEIKNIVDTYLHWGKIVRNYSTDRYNLVDISFDMK